MTAINTARKKGTRRELAAFIPATTMIKLARMKIAGTLALAVRFTVLSIGTSLRLLFNVRAILRVRYRPYIFLMFASRTSHRE